MSNSLLYFNKEGYPHNFQYIPDTESWEGKIIFDENSDQTFKTQSLHIFEEVDPIDFIITADLINIDYNNNSGLTIAGETDFQNEVISNIIKVNESSEFYSKWIYGYDFHRKFPIGAIICFSGVTGSTSTSGLTDFNEDQYFTVLSNKKNAFLITTNTRNDIFDLTFISGYTSSLNMISINDYKRNLSGQTFFQNLYTNKKFSIINSEYNDNVISVKKSGITYSYLNELKLNGVKDQTFELKIQLFTERPKIFQGDITISGSQYLTTKNKYIKLLEAISGETDKEIIFEDLLGNKLYSGSTFTVESIITSEFIATKSLIFKQYQQQSNNYQYNSKLSNITRWNTIQFNGFLNIAPGDIISLEAITGHTFSNGREFSISNVVYNEDTSTTILFTPNYIIEESGATYNITKNLQSNQTITAVVTHTGDISAFNDVLIVDACCYSTSNFINFSQTYISSGATTGTTASNTIDAFISENKATLYQYGIDIYHSDSDYLSIESLYGTSHGYFSASGYTDNIQISDDFSLTDNGLTKKYDIITNEKLYSERTNKSSSELYKNQVPTEIFFQLQGDIDRFGFRLTVNGNQYSINYKNDTQTTINEFINKFGDIFYSNGFLISSGYSADYSGYTLNITSDVDIWDLEVLVNILSSYTIIERQRNRAILFSGDEIISSTPILFDVGLATGMIIKISGSSYNTNNKEYNIIDLTIDTISLSYQGVFISENNVLIHGKTREFIRKPRGEYNRDIYLRAYWETPYDNVIDESIFFYDISGDQLVPYNNDSQYKYTGPKPLIFTEDPAEPCGSRQTNIVMLNKEPNKDLLKISIPKYQQTVFDDLTFKLEQLDSSASYNWIPEPLEIYIGYNSPIEGVNSRVLKIEKIEKKENEINYFSYTGFTNSGSSTSIPNFIFDGNTLNYKAFPDFNFISYGFKKDQLIKFYLKDQSKTNQRIFENVYAYKIQDVYRTKIIIDSGYTYKYSGVETGYTYQSTGFTYFTSTGVTFYFKIEVQPKEILSCPIYGQTEIEDIRYKVNLNNVGIQSEEDVYQMLYLSDIEDNAVDYTLFNRKRKEMLTTFREIYDYIGSYKALINAINYFGYNDLQLYEYYKNVDKSSSLYRKLHKVLIPDIFDNTVEGWNEMDFIAGKYQNFNNIENKIVWKKTNLFNLAYRITDEDGNNVLIYSLDEIQYKLTKLKGWLRKNIIPISADLVDITGVADTNQTLYQDYDESNQTMKTVTERDSTVINFNYTATLNFGSDYLVTVNFYIMSGATGTTIDYNEVPQSFSAKIKTYYLSACTDSASEILVPAQYFKIFKNDLKPFSFNLDKYVDPYIYIETTTYDNSGNGLGYVNNKLFYFDEPRNYWLVNNNFDLTKMKYWQTTDFIDNKPKKWVYDELYDGSTAASSSIETIVKINALNNKYLSKIYTNTNK